ncbi:hypothetical protein JCM33374_g1284 [Metschnikowia sp. JCM 33374]|nr:hypothetical protein JCM33374_g1284 [Metschnikowia sp. JCM 33374]
MPGNSSPAQQNIPKFPREDANVNRVVDRFLPVATIVTSPKVPRISSSGYDTHHPEQQLHFACDPLQYHHSEFKSINGNPASLSQSKTRLPNIQQITHALTSPSSGSLCRPSIELLHTLSANPGPQSLLSWSPPKHDAGYSVNYKGHPTKLDPSNQFSPTYQAPHGFYSPISPIYHSMPAYSVFKDPSSAPSYPKQEYSSHLPIQTQIDYTDDGVDVPKSTSETPRCPPENHKVRPFNETEEERQTSADARQAFAKLFPFFLQANARNYCGVLVECLKQCHHHFTLEQFYHFLYRWNADCDSFQIANGLDNNIVLGMSHLGRLAKLTYPELASRRRGPRGDSRYHYVNIKWNGDVVNKDILNLADLDLAQIKEHFKNHDTKLVTNYMASCGNKTRHSPTNHTRKNTTTFSNSEIQSKPVRIPYSSVDLSMRYPDLWKPLRLLISDGGRLSRPSTSGLSTEDGYFVSISVFRAINELEHWSAPQEAFLHLYVVILVSIFSLAISSYLVYLTVINTLWWTFRESQSDEEISHLASVDENSLFSFTRVLRKLVMINEQTSRKVKFT